VRGTQPGRDGRAYRASAGGRAVQILRPEGLRGLALRALHRLGLYRRLIVYGGRDQRRPPPPRLPLEFGQLGTDELEEYRAYRPDTPASELRRRFDEGQWCHVARHEGRLVASTWTARDHVWIGYVHCRIRLRDDCIYAYDTYVRRDLRGEDLATAIEDYRRATIEAAGYERITALILPLNRPASRHSDKQKDTAIGDLRCWRLGPWCRHSLRLRPSRKGPMVALADPAE
jgi:hypothetical protein